MNYSTSEENYLKTIFRLQETEAVVTTNRLADALKTKPASVTDMMKKLNAKKLLHYKPYYGFSLTPAGTKIALSVIRRHRLWEYFLAEKLHFGWDEVHGMAEQLEHIQHKKLIDRLDEFLGRPAFDPHGDPIPASNGKIKTLQKTSLAQMPLNQYGSVCQVTNQSAEMLELLQHKKIGIGTRLAVKKHFHFDQSLEIKMKQTTITLSQELANNIFINYETKI